MGGMPLFTSTKKRHMVETLTSTTIFRTCSVKMEFEMRCSGMNLVKIIDPCSTSLFFVLA